MLLFLLTGDAGPFDYPEITIDGYVAPILDSAKGQILFSTPYSIASHTDPSLEFRSGGALVFRKILKSAAAAPAFASSIAIAMNCS